MCDKDDWRGRRRERFLDFAVVVGLGLYGAWLVSMTLAFLALAYKIITTPI